MATTPNLGVTHIESNQSQKEVTANEAFDTLDEAIAGQITHDMASDANYTLDTSEPAKEHENLVIHITDTGTNLTAQRDIILPESPQLHVAWNATAQSLRFKTASGTGLVVAAGEVRLFYIDGTNYNATEIANDNVSAASYAVTDLTDAPSVYTGDGGKVLKVKGTEDGIEFVNETAATGVFWATPFKGALADLASDITLVNASSGYTVVWDTEVRDTDAFINLGTNATRITIPADIALVRLTGALKLDDVSTGTNLQLRVLKNGVLMSDAVQDIEAGYTNPGIQVTTPVLSVTNGDYFELELYSSDTSITIKADSWFQLEVLQISAAANPPYDIGFFFGGVPTNSQEILRLKVTRGFTIPDGATGSNAEAGTASTGNVAFSLKRNGTEFATVTFNISAAGTFAQTGDETFVEDDVLTVVAPASADATLANVGFMLKGTRTT